MVWPLRLAGKFLLRFDKNVTLGVRLLRSCLFAFPKVDFKVDFIHIKLREKVPKVDFL